MTLNRREAEKGSGDWSPGGFGIVAMRPLCGIQHGGNRKERLRVREAGASAAGRGQRPYASFPDDFDLSPPKSPKNPITPLKTSRDTLHPGTGVTSRTISPCGVRSGAGVTMGNGKR